MAVEIRPIARDDVRAAIALLIGGSLTPEYERPDRPDDYWQAVEETRRQHGDVLVAQKDGEVVGVCQVIIFRHFQHAGGWCAELESVHVRDDLRSQGIGAQLLAGAEALARERGCYRVQLTSRNVREDAHRFYRTNGYAQTSQGFKKFFD
jgi:GNAT superfamily N-acetyltransferase